MKQNDVEAEVEEGSASGYQDGVQNKQQPQRDLTTSRLYAGSPRMLNITFEYGNFVGKGQVQVKAP